MCIRDSSYTICKLHRKNRKVNVFIITAHIIDYLTETCHNIPFVPNFCLCPMSLNGQEGKLKVAMLQKITFLIRYNLKHATKVKHY